MTPLGIKSIENRHNFHLSSLQPFLADAVDDDDTASFVDVVGPTVDAAHETAQQDAVVESELADVDQTMVVEEPINVARNVPSAVPSSGSSVLERGGKAASKGGSGSVGGLASGSAGVGPSTARRTSAAAMAAKKKFAAIGKTRNSGSFKSAAAAVDATSIADVTAVVTAGENAEGQPGWPALAQASASPAQERAIAIATNEPTGPDEAVTEATSIAAFVDPADRPIRSAAGTGSSVMSEFPDPAFASTVAAAALGTGGVDGAEAAPAPAAPQQQQFDFLPIIDRFKSKQAAHRKSAYLELTKLVASQSTAASLSSDHECILLSCSYLVAAVGDSNQLNSEAGIQLVAALCTSTAPQRFLRSIVTDASTEGPAALVSKLSSKGFAASRPAVSEVAVDAAAAIMNALADEAAKTKGGPDAKTAAAEFCKLIKDEVEPGLKMMSKPKLARSIARLALRLVPRLSASGSGLIKVPATAFTAALPNLLMSTDKQLHASGLELAQALHVGPYPSEIAAMCSAYNKAGGFSGDLIATITSGASVAKAPSAPSAFGNTGGSVGAGAGVASTTASSGPASSSAASSSSASSSSPDAAWDEIDARYDAAADDAATVGSCDKVMKRIPAKLPASDGQNVALEVLMKMPKWNDRVAGLQAITKGVEVFNRLDDGSVHAYGDVLSHMRAALKDSNTQVIIASIQAHVAFASRLRSVFAPAAKQVLPDLIGKLKDKNKSIVTAVSTALRGFVRWSCLAIDEVASEVCPTSSSEAWKKAGPEFKANLCALLASMLQSQACCPSGYINGNNAASTARIKALASIIDACVGDANPTVKAAAEKCLSALIIAAATSKKEGKDQADISKIIDKLPKASVDRVLKDVDGTGSSSGSASAAAAAGGDENVAPMATTASAALAGAKAPVKATAAVPAAVSSKPAVTAAAAAPTVSKLAHTVGISTTASLPSASASSASSSSASGWQALWESLTTEEAGGPLPSPDDAAEALLSLSHPSFTTQHAAQLDSKKWDERKSAIEGLAAATVDAMSASSAAASSPAIVDRAVALLDARTNGFKSLTNPAVVVACATAITTIAAACTSQTQFSRRAAGVAIDGMMNYSKEKRGGEDVIAMCTGVARVVGPNFVASRVMDAAATTPASSSSSAGVGAGAKGPKGGAGASSSSTSQPTPGLMTAAVTILHRLASTYGMHRVMAIPLMMHLCGTSGLQAQSIDVRNAGKRAIVSLYRQVGPQVLSMLADPKTLKLATPLPEQVLKAVTKECEECNGGAGYDAAAARTIMDATTPLAGASASSAAVAGPGLGFTSQLDGLGMDVLGGEGQDQEEPAKPAVDILSLLPKDCLVDMAVEQEGKDKADAKKVRAWLVAPSRVVVDRLMRDSCAIAVTRAHCVTQVPIQPYSPFHILTSVMHKPFSIPIPPLALCRPLWAVNPRTRRRGRSARRPSSSSRPSLSSV